MEKNIIIYDNDLKYKKNRRIDFSSNLIKFASDDIKNKLLLNLDTVEYRMLEAEKVNFTMIDLSHLSLTNINTLFNSKHYDSCEILFLNDNNLSNTVDFSNFKKLLILDITSNKISSLKLPQTLIELTANNNNIVELQSDLNNLLRLIINNNKLKIIEVYLKLELLEIASNNIEIIKFYPVIKKIVAHDNPLKQIVQCPTLTYLDITECPINEIPAFPIIKHLSASKTKLTAVDPLMKNLEFIEIINTPVKRLGYFENFDVILLSLDLTKSISTKYKTIANSIINTKGTIVSISKNLS